MEKLHDFMLLFRFEPDTNYQPTEADMADQKKTWGTWLSAMASQAKLVSTSQLGFNGRQLYADQSIAEGMHIAERKIVGGNAVVKAAGLGEAIELAKGCPILSMGGSVEVRDIIPM